MFTLLKTEILNRFDPDYAYLKQAIRTGLGALIAIALYRCQNQWMQGYWIVLAAAFLMQTRLGNTQTQQMLTVLTCGISAAFLAFLVGFFWQDTFLLATFLAVTTFMAIYFSVLGSTVAIAAFFVNLFVIMSAGLVTDASGQRERFFMILLGSFITLLMCLLWPTKPLENWQRALKTYFLCLAEFSEALSRSYLHDEYHLKKAKFEKRLHERRNRALRLLNGVRHAYQLLYKKALVSTTDLTMYKTFVEKSEHLFSALVALGNIRHKIEMHHNIAEWKVLATRIHREISYLLKQNCFLEHTVDYQRLEVEIDQFQKIAAQQPQDLQVALSSFIHCVKNVIKELK